MHIITLTKVGINGLPDSPVYIPLTTIRCFEPEGDCTRIYWEGVSLLVRETCGQVVDQVARLGWTFRLPKRLPDWDGVTTLTLPQIKNLLERFCAGQGILTDHLSVEENKLIREYLHSGDASVSLKDKRCYPERHVFEELYYLRGWLVFIEGEAAITKEGKNWLKVEPLTKEEREEDLDYEVYNPNSPVPLIS